MGLLVSRNGPLQTRLGGSLSLMFTQVIAEDCAIICINQLPGTDIKEPGKIKQGFQKKVLYCPFSQHLGFYLS